MSATLHLGTCSWKYPSWVGTVYSVFARPDDYLAEYAATYDTVEVDQWYWSLFGPDKLVLPHRAVVADYSAAVPDGFRFGIKLPDALTLTHYRPNSTSCAPTASHRCSSRGTSCLRSRTSAPGMRTACPTPS